jgi:hypothetical protein
MSKTDFLRLPPSLAALRSSDLRLRRLNQIHLRLGREAAVIPSSFFDRHLQILRQVESVESPLLDVQRPDLRRLTGLVKLFEPYRVLRFSLHLESNLDRHPSLTPIVQLIARCYSRGGPFTNYRAPMTAESEGAPRHTGYGTALSTAEAGRLTEVPSKRPSSISPNTGTEILLLPPPPGYSQVTRSGLGWEAGSGPGEAAFAAYRRGRLLASSGSPCCYVARASLTAVTVPQQFTVPLLRKPPLSRAHSPAS